MPGLTRPIGNAHDRTRNYLQPSGPSPMANLFTSNVNGSQTIRRAQPNIFQPSGQQPQYSLPNILQPNPPMIGRAPLNIFQHHQQSTPSPLMEAVGDQRTGAVNDALDRHYAIGNAMRQMQGQSYGIVNPPPPANSIPTVQLTAPGSGYQQHMANAGASSALQYVDAMLGAPGYRQGQSLAAPAQQAVAAGQQMQDNILHRGTIGGDSQQARFGAGGLFGNAQPLGPNQYVTGYGADAQVNTITPREGWEDSQQVLKRNYEPGKPGPDGFNVLQRGDGSYAMTSSGINEGLATATPDADGTLRFAEDVQESGSHHQSQFVANPGDFDSPGAVPIDVLGRELFWNPDDEQWETTDRVAVEGGPVGRISSFTAPKYRGAAARDIQRRAQWREDNGGMASKDIQRLKNRRITLRRAVRNGILTRSQADSRLSAFKDKIRKRSENRGNILAPSTASGSPTDELADGGRRVLISPTGDLIRVPHQFSDAERATAQQDFQRLLNGDDLVSTASRQMLQGTGLDQIQTLPDFWNAFGTEKMQSMLTDPSDSGQLFRKAAFTMLRGMYLADPAGRDSEIGTNRKESDLFRDIAKVDLSDPEAVQTWMQDYLQRNIEHVRQPGFYGSSGSSAQQPAPSLQSPYMM